MARAQLLQTRTPIFCFQHINTAPSPPPCRPCSAILGALRRCPAAPRPEERSAAQHPLRLEPLEEPRACLAAWGQLPRAHNPARRKQQAAEPSAADCLAARWAAQRRQQPRRRRSLPAPRHHSRKRKRVALPRSSPSLRRNCQRPIRCLTLSKRAVSDNHPFSTRPRCSNRHSNHSSSSNRQQVRRCHSQPRVPLAQPTSTTSSSEGANEMPERMAPALSMSCHRYS